MSVNTEIKRIIPTDSNLDMLAFFNATDEVFFSMDFIESKITMMTDSCERLFGYEASAFMDNYWLWLELVHPEDRDIVSNQYEVLQKGRRVNSQYRIIHKDNTVKWVERKIVPVLDDTGKLVRFSGVIRDITTRKEEEDIRRKGESIYRNIVETTQEGIWTIDEKEKTNFVNKKLCELLGYTSEEMIGKELYDFMDEEGIIYAKACMERRRGGAKENLDIRYITKEGKDLWANISTNPIFDETGSYKGALAMVTDITNKRANENALRKSEANLRTIFENTDSAYVLIDADIKILSFNALAQKYCEQHNKRKLIVNGQVKDYFSPERWPIVHQMFEKVTRGEFVSYELNLPGENGASVWYDVRWLAVRNNLGKNLGFVLVNKDITEAKTIALERERITADLIQHNSDLEQFAYIISHNLRSPIANIKGLSNILIEDDDLDGDVRHGIIDRIANSINNIDVVINDLNHILQTRAVTEKKETVYFESLADTIRTSLYNSVPNDDVKFKFDFQEVGSMFTIRSYAYSIFYNLTSNSIKYRQPNVPLVISVKSYRLSDTIELHFKDNGKGIDLKKNGNQVFGLYKRFDTTTEGKGMGLFMVKTQVAAMGGTINIVSKPDEGTEFIIQFPIQAVLPPR